MPKESLHGATNLCQVSQRQKTLPNTSALQPFGADAGVEITLKAFLSENRFQNLFAFFLFALFMLLPQGITWGVHYLRPDLQTQLTRASRGQR